MTLPARRTILLTVLAGGLAACARHAPFQLQPLLPEDGAPLRLTVAAAEALDRRDPGAASADFFARRRDDRLAAATVELLRARVQPAGGTGTARAELTRAAIVERPLTPQGGWFDRSPELELEATLATRIAVLDETGAELAAALTEVLRVKPVPRGSGAVELDALAQQLMREVLRDLDAGLQQSARANLGAYLLV